MQTLLGIFFILVIIAIPLVPALLILKAQGGPAVYAAKKREKQMEAAMRLQLADAELQERVALKIIRERESR